MAQAIVMPSFGMFTAEGRIASWRASSGARVEAGQPVAEIETEKAIQEVVAPASGILHVVAEEGAAVKEQELLAYVLAEGERPPSPDPVERSGARSAMPPVRTRAQEGTTRVVATPEARRLATQLGIDLSRVTGTGPGGRIVALDVTTAARSRP